VQQPSAFSNSAIFGSFALSAGGMDLVTNPGEEDMAGVWLPNGGAAFFGALDINDNGIISRGNTNSLSGSYLVQGSGRAISGSMTAANLNAPGTVNFYVVNASTVLFLEQDSNRVITGSMVKQY
jgi:hypothetical protein